MDAIVPVAERRRGVCAQRKRRQAGAGGVISNAAKR
jgi:hypothetical protein